jgi:hypothetical protein
MGEETTLSGRFIKNKEQGAKKTFVFWGWEKTEKKVLSKNKFFGGCRLRGECRSERVGARRFHLFMLFISLFSPPISSSGGRVFRVSVGACACVTSRAKKVAEPQDLC